MKNLRDSFFPVGLLDAAAFHQALAVLAIHLPFNRSKDLNKSLDYETTEIIAHHAKAIKMLKLRMEDVNSATSDGTVGTIVLMVCYAVRSNTTQCSGYSLTEYSICRKISRCGNLICVD
jgi:hypothetical protein